MKNPILDVSELQQKLHGKEFTKDGINFIFQGGSICQFPKVGNEFTAMIHYELKPDADGTIILSSLNPNVFWEYKFVLGFVPVETNLNGLISL